ncbi:MAG TPA: permease prefix domain 1-containing protein [Planctomycetaceae bacterium]|jgi:hypothetical protein|nr:permease prefix domain 1-containing protein [Planctomycetaceae bacterium]
MSEPEFEAFLRQLAHSLQLKELQKQAVADELRDHLEERLQLLMAQGRSREEACQQALAEFGDAVTLAHDFTLPQQRLQRRRTVRYTLTSATLVVTTFVMASFYWPVQRPEPFGQVVAQTDPQPGFIEVPIAAAPDKVELLRQEIEAKLQKRDLSFSMVDVPFQDALQYVSDALEVDVIINNRVFEENGVDLSTPVNLTLRTGNVSAKTALRLLLRQIQMEKTAAIVIRDGFIDITETDNSHEVQVYNCRDLLENVTVDQVQAARGGHGGGGMFQIGGAAGEGAGGGLGLGGSSGGVGIGLSTSCGTSSAGVALMHVLQQASQTDWMDIDGNGGTMTEFNGLITIGHTQEVHERINEILKKLRAANTQGAPANGAASGQRKS